MIVALLLAGLAPATATAAATSRDGRTLAALRAERVVLLRRIAHLTDRAAIARARAARGRQREALAATTFEQTRVRAARYLVDSFVGGVQTPKVEKLRRSVYADVASKPERELLASVARARDAATAEIAAADRAYDDAQRTTTELRGLQRKLERTIADRERADPASVKARRRATPAAVLSFRPRFTRSTRLQGDLFATYPFGPVVGMPAGLAPTGQVITGKASWYGPGFDGRTTASGAVFDQEGPTVASKELPLGTILLIHRAGRSVLVLVNDRGPYVAGRVLDLSHGVAAALGTIHAGVAEVTAEVLAPIEPAPAAV